VDTNLNGDNNDDDDDDDDNNTNDSRGSKKEAVDDNDQVVIISISVLIGVIVFILILVFCCHWKYSRNYRPKPVKKKRTDPVQRQSTGAILCFHFLLCLSQKTDDLLATVQKTCLLNLFTLFDWWLYYIILNILK